MKPWVQWFINHKAKYMLVIIALVAYPLIGILWFIPKGVALVCIEMFECMCSDIKEILK